MPFKQVNVTQTTWTHKAQETASSKVQNILQKHCLKKKQNKAKSGNDQIISIKYTHAQVQKSIVCVI